jgi:hypothetical protein
MTSLATLALLTAGEKPSSPAIRGALEFLRNFGPADLGSTYAISLQTMVYAAAEPERDHLRIAANAKWLEKAQIRRVDQVPWPGSWSYSDTKRAQAGDNSNSHYALLGLQAASEVGVPIDPRVWALAREYWEHSQRPDRSWSYTPQSSVSTNSMTCAGISSLAITGLHMPKGQEYLRKGKIHDCGKGAVDRNLQAGIDWLEAHFQVGQNFGAGQQWKFYYLCGLKRAGRLTGIQFFGNHDWYRLGAEELVHEQDKLSGFWRGALMEQNPELATSFALLFLANGGAMANEKAPVLIAKLQHGMRDVTNNSRRNELPMDWNNDPYDIRNLVATVSRDWKNVLTWQSVDPSIAAVPELLQAPILFFNGHQAPEFSDSAKRNIRESIEKGGFLLADACCSSEAFTEGFVRLMKEIFPEEESRLQPLAKEHPVWQAKHALNFNVFPLWGIDRGGRTVVIFCPWDLSCFWNQSQRSPADPAVIQAIQVGQNIVDYATGGKLPSDKLRLLSVPDNEPKPARKVKRR